jgi:hypothetical protein
MRVHKGGARQALSLALALCGAVGMVLVVCQSAMAQSTPKTVFACKKAFGPGSKRTACIKRVEHEKPGSNCSHPLYHSLTQVASVGGTDRTDATIIRRTSSHSDASAPVYTIGNPRESISETFYDEVEWRTNARVEICTARINVFVHNNPKIPSESQVEPIMMHTGPHSGGPAIIEYAPGPNTGYSITLALKYTHKA